MQSGKQKHLSSDFILPQVLVLASEALLAALAVLGQP